jgi:hypothetical protein
MKLFEVAVEFTGRAIVMSLFNTLDNLFQQNVVLPDPEFQRGVPEKMARCPFS